MPAYTLEIVGGSTYTFDGAAHIQPTLDVAWDPEYNRTQVPAILTAQNEIWTLKGFVYRDTTPGNITTDLADLAAILSGRSAQVSSIVLLYNGSPVRTLSGTSLMIRGARMNGGPGSLVNHWHGDLVAVGRTLIPDGSNIVSLNMQQEDTYDAAGLHTQTLTGEIEVMPGTGIPAIVQGYGLTSLGNNYVFTTGGPGGVDIRITNAPSNTKGSFKSQQIERGENLPSGALDWKHDTTVADGADGRITSVAAASRSSILATALSAARSVKPSTGVRVTQERQDATSLTVTATYTALAARPAQAAFYGATGKINFIARQITIEGGSQETKFTRVNGYEPFETQAAQVEVIVRERVQVRAIGIQNIADIPLPALLFPASYLQPQSTDGPPYRVSKAEQGPSDEWARDAFRLYAIGSPSKIDFGALFTAVYNAPTFAAQDDFTARTAVVANS
jgi:hypothetical protein